MRKKLHKVLALSMAVMMAGSLAACGSSSTTTDSSGTTGATEAAGAASDTGSSQASGDESKEIIFWNIGTESPDKDIYEYAVKQFNENTTSGYTVKSVATQNDTYKEKLIIAMSSGECPDVYTSWSGGPMNEYIESGFAQPLDDLLAGTVMEEKAMDAALAQAQYEGKTYAIPMLNVSVAGVFYNKEMFEKYNIEVPTTIAELEAACETLKANNITPFALANGSKWTGSMYFMSLAARKGGLEPFQKAVAGEGSFEDEAFVYAGEKIQEWVQAGYFPEGVNSLSEDDGQAKQLMYQETAAMLCCGSWYTGNFQADSPEFYEKIGWFSFPAVDDSSADSSIQIGTVGDQFVSFNCTGEKLEAALEFASYWYTDEAIQMMVDNGKIPPIKGIESSITDGVTGSILDAVTNASSVQLWYDQYLPPAVANVHLDTCQEIFGLTMTPEEANQKLQTAMEEYNAGK